MLRSRKSFDSHAWTGEKDYVEVEALPVAIILGGLAMLIIALLV
jgi:hypothetical protein